MSKRLIVIAGPTASGKTARAIKVALCEGTEIVSCDSRQFYSEMRIGVARPTDAQLAAVKHHFIACRSAQEPYNIYDYEHDALRQINHIFESHDSAVLCGGSGLYINAVLHGIALMPDPTPELRQQLKELYASQGIEALQAMLRDKDPAFYAVVDRNNPIRLQRALEVTIMAGRPYSQILAEQQPAPRPFEVEIELMMPHADILRQRIDSRVDDMIANGLPDEAISLWPLRHINTLCTVGYREFFAYPSPEEALDHLPEISKQIKLNTWHYAKKQMTWCKKYLKEGKVNCE